MSLIVVSVQIMKKTSAEKSETGFPQPAAAPVFTERFRFLQDLCDTTQKSAHRCNYRRIRGGAFPAGAGNRS